jgi:hypothetical protein
MLQIVHKGTRNAWQLVTIAMIMVSATWLIYAVARSPHRNDLASFGQYAAAVATIAGGLARLVWKRAADKKTPAAIPESGRLATLLAMAVKEQWEHAAAERGLTEPEPIPVRYAKPSRSLAGPSSAAISSARFPPLPGLAPISEQSLKAGRISDLHAVYGGLGSGRLVIAGAPGSGKSAAAVLLILAALRHRESLTGPEQTRVPVPVIFTMHGWDPNTQQVADWLADRLGETYPLFAGKRGRAAAAELISTGQIAVILDGLDEISADLRPTALRALSRQANFRVVVLTRTAQMARSARQALLMGAAAVELQDVPAAIAAEYLTRAQRDPAPRGWGELIDRLRSQPKGALARALSSPLTLTLIRDTYSSADDARELLQFCDAAGSGVTRKEVEDHLLDRILPAAYTPQPGSPLPRYQLAAAQQGLASIAARMNQDGTRDLAWWRIPAWAPGVSRPIGIAIPLVGIGLNFAGVAFSPVFGIASCLLWFAYQCLSRRIRHLTPQTASLRRLRGGFNRVAAAGFISALAIGLVIGLVNWFLEGAGIGLVTGLVAGLASTVTAVLMFVIFKPLESTNSPLTPMASWKQDLNFLLAITIMCLLSFILLDLIVAGLRTGLMWGLAIGLATGLLSATFLSASWRSLLVFPSLSRQWHTPARLMKFLEDARRRGILRTIGPVYQFRHARLRDRLASQAQRPGERTATESLDSDRLGNALHT